MNHYKTETTVPLVDTAPLFASIWLALFNELRKNFEERRQTSDTETESRQVIEKNQGARG